MSKEYIKETYIQNTQPHQGTQMMGSNMSQQPMMQPQVISQQPMMTGSTIPQQGITGQTIGMQPHVISQQPMMMGNTSYCPVDCQEMACPMECRETHSHHTHNEKHKHHHGIFHRRDEDISGVTTTTNTTYCPLDCQEMACPLDCTTSHRHHTHNEKHKNRGGLFHRKEKDTY